MDHITVNVQVKELLDSLPHKEKVYVAFDIDETLITSSNVKHLFNEPSDVFKYQYKGVFAPIPEMVSLYKWVRLQGFKTLILTGRKESLRNATIKNLARIGITDWDLLHFKPTKGRVDTALYKMNIRKSVYDSGNIIIANIGDQESDFYGGYFEYKYLLKSTY